MYTWTYGRIVQVYTHTHTAAMAASYAATSPGTDTKPVMKSLADPPKANKVAPSKASDILRPPRATLMALKRLGSNDHKPRRKCMYIYIYNMQLHIYLQM